MLAVAISGVIIAAITTTILQMFTGGARTSNHMTAVRQVQNAGYWVSHDGQMAQMVVITGVSGFPLILTRTDWETGDEYEVVYDYDLVDKKLQRSYSVDDGSTVVTTVTIVAEFVDSANCKFAAGSAFRLPDIDDAFTITGAVGGDSGTITVTAGSITVTLGGTASYDAGTGAWRTLAANDAVAVAAAKSGTTGSWTATTGTATAAITTDDENTTLADGGVLIFTVTATVGDAIETRTYEITPRPT